MSTLLNTVLQSNANWMVRLFNEPKQTLGMFSRFSAFSPPLSWDAEG